MKAETPHFLEGKRTYLRGITAQDVPRIAAWSDDRVVTRYLFRGAYPADVDTMERARQQSVANPHEVELAVMDRDDDAFIGTTGLHGINWVARTGEFRILLGEKAYWGKGAGTEVCLLMCAYGFEVLNLNKVWLGVTSDNIGALRSYEKSGFVKEGALRQEVYRNSTFYDAIRMSLLRTEYDAALPGWRIAEEIATMFPRDKG